MKAIEIFFVAGEIKTEILSGLRWFDLSIVQDVANEPPVLLGDQSRAPSITGPSPPIQRMSAKKPRAEAPSLFPETERYDVPPDESRST